MFKLRWRCLAVALLVAALGVGGVRAGEETVAKGVAANTEPAADSQPKQADETPNSQENASRDAKPNGNKTVGATVGNASASNQDGMLLPRLLQELIERDKKVLVDLIDVKNIPQSDAVDAITEAGLKVGKITYEYDDRVPAGYVVRQYPEKGVQAEANSEVDLVVAQTEIAIEPFRLTRDVGTGSFSWGQTIVHRPFHMEVETSGDQYRETKRQIPMFTIFCDGIDGNVAGNDYGRLQRRAQSIAERLLTSWDMMDQGATLEVVAEDDLDKWKVRGPYAPSYPENADNAERITSCDQVHIDAVPKGRGGHPLRIMTVYPADAKLYGSPVEVDENGNLLPRANPLSPRETAEYFVSVIQAHHLLFHRMSDKKEEYRNLEFAKSDAGSIFELLKDDVVNVQHEGLTRDSLRRAIARLKVHVMNFERLARSVPEDWRIRGQGW